MNKSILLALIIFIINPNTTFSQKDNRAFILSGISLLEKSDVIDNAGYYSGISFQRKITGNEKFRLISGITFERFVSNHVSTLIFEDHINPAIGFTGSSTFNRKAILYDFNLPVLLEVGDKWRSQTGLSLGYGMQYFTKTINESNSKESPTLNKEFEFQKRFGLSLQQSVLYTIPIEDFEIMLMPKIEYYVSGFKVHSSSIGKTLLGPACFSMNVGFGF
ncbi:MAG: hypothetical protein GC181_14990 [Bacteroidetes bacterium]|nr:hypothetical protein [Bacteroidota bacterium]